MDAEPNSHAFLRFAVPGEPTSTTVADLFGQAAAALRYRGLLTVHHVAFETVDNSTAPSVSLTVYYERVERRRHERES